METFLCYAVLNLLSFILCHRLSVVLLLIFANSPSVLTAGGVAEYCEWESFNATCASDEVILIQSARYGRMNTGRCLTSLYPGEVCSTDVTSELDRKCSGRNRCSVEVISMHGWHCESRNFKNFLEASYECRKVANGRFHMCTNESSIVLPVAESGILASTFASTESEPCPFVIRVQPYQRINLTLIDFSFIRADQNTRSPGYSENCRQVAIATELHDNRSSTVVEMCRGRERVTAVYMSMTNTVAIKFNKSCAQHAVIKYQAVGCAPLVAPPNTWVSRTTEQTTSIQCNQTDEAWHLTCFGVHWVGEIGNCTAQGSRDDWHFDNSSQYPLGVLAVVCLGVTIGVAVGVLLLVIFIAYMRRRRRKRSKLQIRQPVSAFDNKTTFQKASFSNLSQRQITPLSVATATTNFGSWTRNRPLPDPQSQVNMLYFPHATPSTACSFATPFRPFEVTLLSPSRLGLGTPSPSVCCTLQGTAGRAGCDRTGSSQLPLNVGLETEEACALMCCQSESWLPGNSARERMGLDSASPYYFKLDPVMIERQDEEERTHARPSPAVTPRSAPILETGCALCHMSATLNRRPHVSHCPSPSPTETVR